MVIQIDGMSRAENVACYEMTCGKTRMFVSYSFRSGLVGACVLNASNRAWRKLGRSFESWDDALKAYRSSEAKAMIEHVRDVEARIASA